MPWRVGKRGMGVIRWSGWVRKAGGRVGGRGSGRQGQDGSRKSVDWRGGKVRGREGGME